MHNIQAFTADLMTECDDEIDLVVRCSMGLWQARLVAKGDPSPLFDRNGIHALCSAQRTTAEAAIAELDALCA